MYCTDQEEMQEDSRECEAMRKMFVGGLNRETSEDEFFDYFGSYGNMVDKVIIKDPESKMSRGFGFITYDSSDCVEAVFKARPHNLGGKTLDVKRAMPRDYNTSVAHSKVTKLFVGGVSPDLTPEELQNYIESRHPTSIGTVDKIDFLKDKDTNKNKGFGFLECSDTDFADRLTISEKNFSIKGKNMSLKKAEPRSGDGGAPGGRGGGRGGVRGYGGRGRGGGRGGGRGRGGGYNNQSYDQGGYDNQNNYNDFSTGYPSYNNSNNGGYNNYNQGYGQQQGGGYGDSYQGGYQNTQHGYGVGNQRGGSRGGNWNSGGGNRYNPY